METDAASFPPQLYVAYNNQEMPASSSENPSASPLVCMARVLEKLESFVEHAREEAGKLKKTFMELHFSVGKLRKAEWLWWKIDPDGEYEQPMLPIAEQ